MNTLSSLLLPGLLGILALGFLLRGTSLPQKGFFILSASLPTGTGICSLILFTCLLLSPAHAKILSWIIAWGMTTALIIYSLVCYFKAPRKVLAWPRLFCFCAPQDRMALIRKIGTIAACGLFLYTAAMVIQFYFLAASTNITGGWDARYFWSLKAKFMFRSPADWQLMFSPVIPWSNPSYPLLWPGTLAWGWNWLGRESLIWGAFASFTFYFPCVFLVIWYLRAQRTAFTGWIAGTFALILGPPLFWSLSQYADMPLTFFITAGSFILTMALRSQTPRLFLIAGLMGGLAAWAKNEGILFLGLLYLVAGADSRRQKRTDLGLSNILISLTRGAWIPLFAVFTVKYLARSCNAGDTVNQTFSSLQGLFSSGGEKAWLILRSFYEYMSSLPSWKGLWGFLVAAALLLGWRRSLTDASPQKLLSIVLLLNAGYFAVLLATRPELLSWQIDTALERLLIHSSFLAVAISFETLTSRVQNTLK